MLAKKLRLVPGTEIIAINAPAQYNTLLGPLPEDVRISCKLTQQHQFIQLFVKDKAELEGSIAGVCSALAPGGLLWITYPKQSSGKQTDLTRDKGWECLDGLQMEWLSLISFSEEWSAFLVRNNPPKKKAVPSSREASVSCFDPVSKTVIIPGDLAEAFKQEKKAKAIFDACAYSHRKEYVVWITAAKRAETRASRVQKTIDMLLAGKKNPTAK